jgi:phage baseplate assembly protein W
VTTKWSDIAYPWGEDLASFAELKSDQDVLKTSIINIILTRRGERVMLPLFGSDVPGMLFEPGDPATVVAIGASIRTAVELWDDRVEFLDYGVEMDGNTLRVKVQWRVKKDPKAESVQVLAFELQPGVLV